MPNCVKSFGKIQSYDNDVCVVGQKLSYCMEDIYNSAAVVEPD